MYKKPDKGLPRKKKKSTPPVFKAKKSRSKGNYPYKKSPASQKTGISAEEGMIRLNKFVANSGVCSRREADELIAAGAISVNGKKVTQLGTKIQPTDVVVYNGQKLKAEKKVYVLLNKPKDYITTADDPEGRKTVIDLVRKACPQRLFPVGRLDRNTTGLLILTNDGELGKKLTHPSYGIRKLYHAQLDKPLTQSDMRTLAEGVVLDGQKVVPDDIAWTGKNNDKSQVGIELHSGQNRVVRRLFESLDYKVVRLDRVMLAGLTKKDLPRGHWRFLTDKEIAFLKMLK